MHEPFFLRGTLLYSSSPDTIEILDDGWLLCRDGRAAGVFRSKPERFANLDVFDYTGKLIIPGMTDLHVHAPQFSFRGLGMDLELLDWLNTYTFPEESKYEDLSYAETAYAYILHALARLFFNRRCVGNCRAFRRFCCGGRLCGLLDIHTRYWWRYVLRPLWF